MKKIFISLWLLLALVQLAMAQNNSSAPAAFGCVSSNGATSTYNVPFMIGQSIYSNYISAAQCHDGFPYDAQYLQNTFVGGLWSSKGYYADYVSLQWSIGNNANSITSFVVSRRLLSDNAATFQVVANLDPSIMSWKDEDCETGTLYEYKVYAAGITNVLTLNLNYVTAIGFRQPVGTATGRITYSGGTAVPDVSVIAQTSPTIPTSAIVLNGKTSFGHIDETKFGSVTSGSAFTFQAWVTVTGSKNNVQTIFDKNKITALYLHNDSVYFEFNDLGKISISYASMAGSYFHVTAELKGKTLLLQLNNGISVLQAKQTFTETQINDIAEGFFIGQDHDNVNGFTGFMDEIRIWSIALDSATIQRDYSRVLTGSETGLGAYYQVNEAVGNMAYDLTHTGNHYNGDDVTLTNIGWTNNTPLLLFIKGVTDVNGNYQISGIPYAAEGSTYTFTPLFGVHTFSPSQALRYFAQGSNISNNVDFTDKSSFHVQGRVLYDKTNVPVQGVNVLVDGSLAISNRTPVTTAADGSFKVDVPIGFHRITLFKQGHTFVDGFPTKTYKNAKGELDSLYDFENDIVSPIRFYDATLATISGRVAGGTVQQAKPLGFGLSKANLGYSKINITLQTTGLLKETTGDSVINLSGNSSINSHFTINGNMVSIYPDTLTGEYAVLLPPGIYTINSAYGNAYTKADDSYSNTDYDFSTQNGGLGQIILDVNKKDSSKYIYTDSILNSKTNKKIAHVDSTIYRFNQRYDFKWRNAPVIKVEQVGQKFFGDSLIVFTDNNGNPIDNLHLNKVQEDVVLQYPDTNVYHFGYPIFHQQVAYTFNIHVYEKYVNFANATSDSIPQNDGGTIEISNALASTTSFSDTLNNKGALTYTFAGGSPNVVAPYILNATFQYNYKLNNVAEAVTWQNGLTGIILGGQSTGSNFITAGPTQVDQILRDPPGSASSAYLQKGTTSSRTTTMAGAVIVSAGVSAEAKFGVKASTAVGFGVMVITEQEVKNDVTVGISNSETNSWDGSTTTTTTNTEQWSTSSDPAYVGSQGDVFIGHSTNLAFSKTLNVGVIKDSTATPVLTTGTSYAFSPQFGTAFLYTQYHIVNELLPNLVKIRNSFFTLQPNIYIPVKSNRYVNTKTWYSAKSDTLYGDAYTFVTSTQMKMANSKQATDSIMIYNQWIENWETILANNEQVKVEAIAAATNNSENHSFDAGTTYENTINTTFEKSSNYSFHTETTISASDVIGTEIAGTGVDVTINGSVGGTFDYTSGTATSKSITYDYTLADNNQGDYLSVNVLKPSDGFGPVFYTRGGQTMCPYEGQELSQYYNPGTVLNVATEANQIPYLFANGNKKAIELNVPSTQQAIFTLNLQNLSQSGVNGQFNLSMVQNSNPNGALVAVDGVSLTHSNGLVFYLPSLGSVNKTLTIAKGPSAILSDTIGIVLSTSCGDASDTVWVIAQFTPACTPVTLTAPLDQWIMNGITGSSLPLKTTGFNANDQNFQSISFEYKPSSSSTWLPLAFFFNDSTSNLYKEEQSTKGIIPSGGTVSYTWDASQMADQNYDIRARSNCSDNITATSSIASGIKDLSPLRVFSTPQPSTGILGIGENISVQFNKTIVVGKIQPDYVQVHGVLNGSAIAHATSLNLDGSTGFAKADGFSFAGSPFTIEFWMQRADINKSGVIFSTGTSTANKIEIANTANGKMKVTIGDNSFNVDPSIIYTSTVPATSWHHYALVYDTLKTLNMYGDQNLVPLISKSGINYSTQERNSIYIGRSVNGDSYGQATINEIRIWNTARSISDVAANMSLQLSGSQQGLVAYWQCNEGTGSLAKDRAGSHTLTVNAPWEIALTNEAISFDATKRQALLVNARQLTLSNQQNATIEFWFKAPTQVRRACLFYNGVKDSTANGYNPYAFGLFMEQNGVLTLTAGASTVNATMGIVSDNAWHHFALVIDRLSNVRTYLDGSLQEQLPTSLFGGIVGLDMSLGAYNKQITSDSSFTDKYFTGLLDEFRIWETARPASLIQTYKNTKLTGIENGLLYYFPFEAYYDMSGVQVLGNTFGNKTDSTTMRAMGVARTDTVVARSINGATFTQQAPPVKDAQPLTNLAVTYVVNNDKLLVNLPSQYASLYENCVLEISVRNIFDKNGNMLQSPAQWTAFVNQNPVLWSTASDTLNLMVGQGGIFSTTIVNKAGVPKDFTINGLPAWLTANPESGTIQPAGTQIINFTVNSGLNIGSYNAPINLTTDYGYDEKLQVFVNVNAQAPKWTVIPGNYQYSMNVFGTLQIAGVIATNTNDMVAAFVNGQCRGVCNLTTLSNFDVDEAMLTIYSNQQSGDTVTFLVWDANTGQTYSNVTPVYTFTSDVVYGTPKNPVLISCGTAIRNSYVLNAGWNWISVNVNNAKSNKVENVLSTIGSAGDVVKGQKSVFDQFSPITGWFGTLDLLNAENMYKLSLAKAGTITLDGTPVNPDSVTISISAGWNWIGYIPQYNETVNEALASYGPQDGDIIKSQKAFSMFYSGIGWIGTLKTMALGYGYMLQTAHNSSLIYPQKGLLKNNIVENIQPAPKVLGYSGSHAQSNATILAQIADSTVDINGKVLAAYSGKQCTGFAYSYKITQGKPLFFLVSDILEDTSSLKFALVDTITGLKTQFTNTLANTGETHTGQLNTPFLLYTKEQSEINASLNKNVVSAYPNPFSSALHISGYLNQATPIVVRLINVLGKELLKLNTSGLKGPFSLDIINQSQISLDKLPAGWYEVEVKTNEGIFHSNVLKQ